MTKFLVTILFFVASPAFAKQSLQDAMGQNPKLAALVNAVKAAAGVDCLLNESFPHKSVRGPDGQSAISHQSACFDPDAFNPSQLGQLEVTYYGEGKSATSSVGEVIEIKFEVFK